MLIWRCPFRATEIAAHSEFAPFFAQVYPRSVTFQQDTSPSLQEGEMAVLGGALSAPLVASHRRDGPGEQLDLAPELLDDLIAPFDGLFQQPAEIDV